MYNKYNMRVSLRKNETGLAAFIVTTFIIIMLSITVMAYSQSTRREQRQALDRQLSSQAFYTAESAVAETRKYLSTAGSRDENTNCNSGEAALSGLDNSATNNFAYTCILWDKSPEHIIQDNLGEGGRLYSLQTKNNSPLDYITVSWQSSTGGTDLSGCDSSQTSFPNVTNYFNSNRCNVGMLRVQLIPYVGSGGNVNDTRNSLANAAYTAFYRPTNSAALITDVARINTGNTEDQARVVPVGCNQGKCTVRIDGLNAGKSFLHIRSIYQKSNLDITGTLTNGSEAEFTENQYEIDATSRTADVVKRVMSYVPINAMRDKQGYAAEIVDGICKDLDVWPGGSDPAVSSCKP